MKSFRLDTSVNGIYLEQPKRKTELARSGFLNQPIISEDKGTHRPNIFGQGKGRYARNCFGVSGNKNKPFRISCSRSTMTAYCNNSSKEKDLPTILRDIKTRRKSINQKQLSAKTASSNCCTTNTQIDLIEKDISFLKSEVVDPLMGFS